MSPRELRADGTIVPRSVAPTWRPPQGYLRQVAECMRVRGWDAVYDPEDGSMLLQVPESQRARADADRRECELAAGLPTGDPPPFTDDQLTVLYQHEIKIVECLRRLGYEVPDPPSEQVFKADYEAGRVALAYSSLPRVDQAEWRRINRECPQEPDGW